MKPGYDQSWTALAANVSDASHERLDYACVELGSTGACYLRDRVLRGKRLFVWPRVCDRIEHVCNSNNSPRDRNRRCAEPGGVAGAVPALMVGKRDLPSHAEHGVLALAQDVCTNRGVGLHHSLLAVR